MSNSPFHNINVSSVICSNIIDDVNSIISNPVGRQRDWQEILKKLSKVQRAISQTNRYIKNCVKYEDGKGLTFTTYKKIPQGK